MFAELLKKTANSHQTTLINKMTQQVCLTKLKYQTKSMFSISQ